MRVQDLTGGRPSLLDDPFALARPADFVAAPLSGPPRLLVVVDTEETFDWDAPFDRQSTDTSAMSEVGLGQELCDAVSLAPTYVVGYPIASDIKAMERLSGYSKAGRATIGSHLHGWVCPPFDEDVNAANSYQGNLPVALEKQKLEVLNRQIEQTTGIVPVIHKAGRHGFGWGTAEVLKDLGYKVDVSPTPGFDLTSDGGPNHENLPNAPQWLDKERQLLSIAGTGGFIGGLRKIGPLLHRVSESPIGRTLKTEGILSRSGLMERIRLSPEGYTLSELKYLTHNLLERGENVFTLTYHSPSLAVGCTPYVRDKQDLKAFLKKIEDYFSFFFDELGGQPSTPLGLLDEIRAAEDA